MNKAVKTLAAAAALASFALIASAPASAHAAQVAQADFGKVAAHIPGNILPW